MAKMFSDRRSMILLLSMTLLATKSFSFKMPAHVPRNANRQNNISPNNSAVSRQTESDATTKFSLFPSRVESMLLSEVPSINSCFPEQPAVFFILYSFIANMIYLLRRSCIRKMPKRRLVKIRLTKETGVTIPLYITNLLVWQIFVTFIFPLLEPISRLFGYVSFYYFYPNASGLGVIFEPVAVQDLPMNKRAKHQIRLDWHKFSVNVGGIGRDGYRHPPSVERNLPHLDIPKLGWKHWPWRRKFKHRV